jgi:hypothetical protein
MKKKEEKAKGIFYNLFFVKIGKRREGERREILILKKNSK